VDAYPEELFESGKIVQVRLGSKEEQNVITYPVIVATPNADSKLLPGMTANLSFQIASKPDIVKIPNAALRFYPDKKRVHPDDHPILDGTAELQEQSKESQKTLSAMEKAESNRSRNNRHVWVQDGEFLRAKAVKLGMSDSRFTELVEGDVKEGDQLVIGEQPKT
jgi:HlyD family secretion protein